MKKKQDFILKAVDSCSFIFFILMLSAGMVFMLSACAARPRKQYGLSERITLEELCWGLEDLVKYEIGCSAQDYVIKACLCEIDTILDLTRQLNLDAEQEAELARIYRTFKRGFKRDQAKMNIALVQLSEIMGVDDLDIRAAMEQLRTVRVLCRKLTERAATTLIRMKEVLTPEQRLRIRDRLFSASRKKEARQQYPVVPCGE